MAAPQTQEIRVKVTGEYKEFQQDMAAVLKIVESTRKQISVTTSKIPKMPTPRMPKMPDQKLPKNIFRPVIQPEVKPVIAPVEMPALPAPVEPQAAPAINEVSTAAEAVQSDMEDAAAGTQEYQKAIECVVKTTKNVKKEIIGLPSALAEQVNNARSNVLPKAVQDIINKAKGISGALSGTAGVSTGEWEKYRRTVLSELEAVQRKAAQTQTLLDKLRPQVFTRDSGAADDYIKMSVAAGWSDVEIDAGLAEKEAASATTKAGQAYAQAQSQLKQYSAAIEQATGRLQGLNAQVDASRQAETVARQRTAAAKEQARAAREAAAAQTRAAREQTAVQRRTASQGRQALGAISGMRVFSSFGTMAAVSGVLALASAASSLGQSLWDAALKNDQFRGSISMVKGNLAVAFQAVYQAALPALQALASWLATATNYFAQFVAVVFGISYDDAVAGAKKEADGIKAIGGAAKSVKRALAGFDELNILSFPGGGGGRGSTAIDITPSFTIDPLDLPKWLNMLLGKEPFDVGEFWKSLTGGSLLTSVLLGIALEPVFPLIGVFLALFLSAWDKWKNGLTKDQKTVILEALAEINLAIMTPAYAYARAITNAVLGWWNGLSDADKTAAVTALAQIGFSFLFGPIPGFVTALRLAWTKWNTLTVDQRKLALNAIVSVVLSIVFAPVKEIISNIRRAWSEWKTRNGGLGGGAAIKAGNVAASVTALLTFVFSLWSDILRALKKAWDAHKAGKSNGSGSIRFSLSSLLSFHFPTWSDILAAARRAWNSVISGKAAPTYSLSFNLGISLSSSEATKNAKKAINAIIDEFNRLIRKINSTISITLPSFLGGGTWGLNLPTIPHVQLAKGGIVTSPTLAWMGEQNKREAVLPLDRNTGWMSDLADVIGSKLQPERSSGGGDNRPLIIMLDGEVVYRSVINRANQDSRRTGRSPLTV